MFLLKLVLALSIIVACLVLLFRYQRQLKAGATTSDSAAGKAEGSRAAELEQFIAAYRREKAAGQTQSVPVGAQSVATGVAASPARPEIKARTAFLAGPLKLAFLVLRAGLPDHHVFAHTRVSDVVDGAALPALANLTIDLLVCTKELAIVAAVDLNSGTQSDALLAREKEQRLRSVGIRYLRFAPGALPKPAEVRKLVYGE